MGNQSIDNFYHDLGFRIDEEQLKSFKLWTVLNHGLITLLVDKKETYECEIYLVPAHWHNMFSEWQELTEEEKRKFIIKKKVLVDYLGYIIPGTILNGSDLKIKKSQKEKIVLEIDVENKKYKSDFLKNLVATDLLKKTPFYKEHELFPCIKIVHEDKSILIPTSEIARYYFFKGVKIPRKLTFGLYEQEYSSSALLLKNQQTSIKTALVSIKQGYTKEERLVFANLALSGKMRNSADYIKGNIHFCLSNPDKKNLAYIKTSFFQEKNFKASVAGYYLDQPHNTIFFGNQILETNELPLFNILDWSPFLGDQRSLKDKNERAELPTKSYKGKKTISSPGPNPRLNPSARPNPTSVPEILEMDNSEENTLFPKHEIEEIKQDKINQHNQYEGDYAIENISGSVYTTNEKGEKDSDVIKGYFTEVQRKHSEALNAKYIEDLDQALTNKFKWAIEYFHEQDEIAYFKDVKNAVKMIDPKISCTILKLERLQNCFYIFEYTDSNSYLNRTTLLHDLNGKAFNKQKIMDVLAVMTESNYSWPTKSKNKGNESDDKDVKLNSIVRRGFNRKNGKENFTIEDIAKNINDYIVKKFSHLDLIKKSK